MQEEKATKLDIKKISEDLIIRIHNTEISLRMMRAQLKEVKQEKTE